MQVTVETTSGLERKMTLQIPADQVEGEVEKRVADTAKKARLPGFRPGKVPRKVVKQRFGESLRAEVLNEVLGKSYQDAIQQESLNPVGNPAFDIVKNEVGENVEFVATFEVFPEVELSDVADISVERLSGEVTDADVDAMIDKLRTQRAEYESVEREAKETDRVNIDFAGKRDGEAFEGGTADGQSLVLGSGQMIPGFEDGIVGMKAGETKALDLTFPEGYQSEELAGQAVVFDVTLIGVEEAKLPELDNEFFKAFEVEGSIEDFRAKVRDNMETQLKDSIQSHLKQQVMDGLIETNDVDLPEALIAQETQALKTSSIQRIGGDTSQFDESMLPDEMFRDQAEKRVALGVIMDKLVKKFEISPSREDLTSFIDEIAESYEDPDSVRNMYMSDEKYLQQINLMVVEKMAVDKIVELAKVTDKSLSYDEVMAAAQSSAQ